MDGFYCPDIHIPDDMDFDLIPPYPNLTFNIECSDRSALPDQRWWDIAALIAASSGTIVLKLGWKTNDLHLPNSEAHLALCRLLPYFFPGQGTVTISPYIPEELHKVNRHAWCFPQKTPHIDVPHISQSYQLPFFYPEYPEIRFKSGCNCGNGDLTECKP